MPMPEFDPRDFEFMNHPVGTKAYGDHGGRHCGQETREKHFHPDFGGPHRWTCTRSRRHMGRHEAGYGTDTIIASWADPPAG